MRVPRERSGGQETAPVDASRYFDTDCRPTTVATAKSLSKRGRCNSDFKPSSVRMMEHCYSRRLQRGRDVEGFVPVLSDGSTSSSVKGLGSAARIFCKVERLSDSARAVACFDDAIIKPNYLS